MSKFQRTIDDTAAVSEALQKESVAIVPEAPEVIKPTSQLNVRIDADIHARFKSKVAIKKARLQRVVEDLLDAWTTDEHGSLIARLDALHTSLQEAGSAMIGRKYAPGSPIAEALISLHKLAEDLENEYILPVDEVKR